MVPSELGFTTQYLFSCDSVNGLKVYNPFTKQWQSLSAAGVAVPVAQLLSD
jgi:hypothetical protein